MRILTVENEIFEMNELPDQVEDLRFCILDNSNPAEPDYYFMPLVFLESFNDPALVLKIGPYTINMPYNWRILIGEAEIGDLEALPLTKLNDRGFEAFTFNPLSSFRAQFMPIDIVDVYQDVRWYFPKLKNGQLLCVPLSKGPKPVCAYFVKDISRASEAIDIQKII
jgi:hypothetical protein